MLPLLIVVWLIKDQLAMWLVGSRDDGNMVLLALDPAMAMGVLGGTRKQSDICIESAALHWQSIACAHHGFGFDVLVYAKQGLSGVFLGQLVALQWRLVVLDAATIKPLWFQ